MAKPVQPIRPRKTSLAIDRQLWNQLRIQSLKEGRPAYHILNELIAAYLQKKGAKS